jgi:hypothetical protein
VGGQANPLHKLPGPAQQYQAWGKAQNCMHFVKPPARLATSLPALRSAAPTQPREFRPPCIYRGTPAACAFVLPVLRTYVSVTSVRPPSQRSNKTFNSTVLHRRNTMVQAGWLLFTKKGPCNL